LTQVVAVIVLDIGFTTSSVHLSKGERNVRKHHLSEHKEKLSISTDNDENSDSEAECPKCGLIYGESSIKWIYCNHCNTWMDISCASVSKSNIPEEYYCSDRQ